MFSFSASYLQINSGLQIPQNYKSLISNKKVFLYKYAKILTCVLIIIRGVVLMHWLMEQQAVSAHVSHSALPIGMSHDCMTGSRCIDKHWAHGIQVLLYKTLEGYPFKSLAITNTNKICGKHIENICWAVKNTFSFESVHNLRQGGRRSVPGGTKNKTRSSLLDLKNSTCPPNFTSGGP